MVHIKRFKLCFFMALTMAILANIGSNKNTFADETTTDAGTTALAPTVVSSGTSTSLLYLNGETGDDNQDGSTAEKAKKSFQKAKEVSTVNKSIAEIIITGTTEISGDVSLDGTNAILKRGDTFSGYLLKVQNQTVNMSNIVVDGNSDNNTQIEKSLIYLGNNSTLNILEGTILKNNKIKDINNTATNGGAISAYNKSTVNMTGGVIENNSATYGGGVYLDKSTMNFSGGVVQNNKAKLTIDKSTYPNQYYSAGGGINAAEGSTINLSGDAKILNNYSNEVGGGISLGKNEWGATNILNMNGGIIDGNTAGSTGGGIFVQAKYFTGGASKAYINSGRITNNVMDATGKTEKMFGGAGIYVNGANNNYGANGANGELYLRNAIITDNESRYQGAGYAACPISVTKIYLTDGVALYGNNSMQKSGNDLYILCNLYLGLHGGNPEYELSKRMLGGVLYDWKNDDGSLLADSKYKGVLSRNREYLALHTDSVGSEFTDVLKKVIISGNRSETRGGGIGSNGTVIIGVDDKDTKIPVSKVWVGADGTNRPKEVVVKLIADGKYLVEKVKLSEENNWEHTFEYLPIANDGNLIKYTVEEEKVSGFISEITGDSTTGFVVTNKKETTPPPDRPNPPTPENPNPPTPENPNPPTPENPNPPTPENPNPPTPENPNPPTPENPNPPTPENPNPPTPKVPRKRLPQMGINNEKDVYTFLGVLILLVLVTFEAYKKMKRV